VSTNFSNLDELFQIVTSRAKNTVLDPSVPKASLHIELTGNDHRDWFLELIPPQVNFRNFNGDDCSLTVTLTDKDFLGIVNKTLNLNRAFLLGKIKLNGDVSLAGKVMKVLRQIYEDKN
jgi:putative sterol carrier protein